jgi:hypothetical protein
MKVAGLLQQTVRPPLLEGFVSTRFASSSSDRGLSRPGTAARRDAAATLVRDASRTAKTRRGEPSGTFATEWECFTNACRELQGVLCSVPVLAVPVAVAPTAGSTGERRG